jgi:hypothetical protein
VKVSQPPHAPNPDPDENNTALQYSPDGQSVLAWQDRPETAAHVPPHTGSGLDVVSHREPFEHSTSSMQAPPSGTNPENAASHGAVMLDGAQESRPQSRWDSTVRQDVAAAPSNVAVPLDTAMIAADAELNPSTGNTESLKALHAVPSGKVPQRTARAQYASSRSITQVEGLVGAP